MESLGDITLLAKMLNTNENDSDSDNEECKVPKQKYNKSDNIKSIDASKKNIYEKVLPTKNLVSEDDFENFESTCSEFYTKPEYHISYRQAISAEDVFLQIGAKTSASASCEDMIMTIKLPGENKNSIDLNVTYTELELKSLKYKLFIPLPHTVDPQKSSAQWETEKETLVLTLRMNRELDFINF